jgi:ornithine cyclodeaminase/alanine dehydrogenase-like protein (mu-crystallin family)
MQPPKILGIHNQKGGFHIKAGLLEGQTSFFAAKMNANFPGNMKEYGLPTIQGVLIASDGETGQLLALMDSIEITILRTGAATAVAAKYLSRQDAKTVAICGCGNQGRVSVKALMEVRPIEKVFAFDTDKDQAEKFVSDLSKELKIPMEVVTDLRKCLLQADIVVTCTPSKKPFIKPGYIKPGTFIAAVGADSEEKQELYAELLIANKVVTDLSEQCACIGELHHALASGHLTIANVYAELGEIVSGSKRGRTADNEIIVFDSTGTALQDVAVAAIVYEKAFVRGLGNKINFSELEPEDSSGISKKMKKDRMSLQ